MINLAIDIGNTRVKTAVFNEHEIIDMQPIDLSDLLAYSLSKGPNYLVVSSVRVEARAVVTQLQHAGLKVFEVNNHTPLPFENNYKTPHTLGIDRVCSMAGAQMLFPEQNCLVVDAGTCVTYDTISTSGSYAGGAISPGLNMRLRALHEFTSKLPLVKPVWFNNLEGNSTEESILSGVCQGLVDEINGKIARYMEHYNPLQVILTGGDADFLGKHLKSNIFVAPSLVLQGLNQILLFNVKKGNWPT